MAITVNYRNYDLVKGPYGASPAAAPFRLYRFSVPMTGTYATGGFQVDLSQYFALKREGVSAINVLWAVAFGDYYDPTNGALTINNSSIALTSSGPHTGNLAQVKLFTGTNGVGGAELANATAIAGFDVGLLAGIQVTHIYQGIS